MKYNILLSVFVLISVCGMAQTSPPPPPVSEYDPSQVERVQIGYDSTRLHSPDTNEVLTFADVMPDFIGEGGFARYLKDNVKYPAAEKMAGKQGKVYLSFIVEKDGKITNVEIVKGVEGAPGFAIEGIRVLSSMPNWHPGLQDGKPMRVKIIQPINFVLDGKAPKKKERKL
ncbi:hypothetical protein BH11BAC7_BH11BAC7_31490 [soil metagenome]